MNLTVTVWRQKNAAEPGQFETYQVAHASEHMSFLEMLDVLNDELTLAGQEPIAFEHDCREGICGSCGFMVDGVAHGPRRGTTVCQLHLRLFKDGDRILLEPWRAKAFPVIRDLMVDRSALDRIVESGGYISAPAGAAPEANALPVPKERAELAFEAAACIGCGACVASCPNASAMLFTGAKVSHLALLPQGQPERYRRVHGMVDRMAAEGFGGCTNVGECEAACPKHIGLPFIAQMNRDLITASFWRPRGGDTLHALAES